MVFLWVFLSFNPVEPGGRTLSHPILKDLNAWCHPAACHQKRQTCRAMVLLDGVHGFCTVMDNLWIIYGYPVWWLSPTPLKNMSPRG